MYLNKRKAFTMVELVFVIVVIGILSAIAIPKFSATRDDALNSKGATTLSAVRNAISTERQKRILRGDFTAITDLANTTDSHIFSKFNNDQGGNANRVLEYSPKAGTGNGKWSKSGTSYIYHYSGGGTCTYTLTNNRLTGTCPVFAE